MSKALISSVTSYLRTNGKSTVTDIASGLAIKRSYVSTIVNNMKRANVIKSINNTKVSEPHVLSLVNKRVSIDMAIQQTMALINTTQNAAYAKKKANAVKVVESSQKAPVGAMVGSDIINFLIKNPNSTTADIRTFFGTYRLFDSIKLCNQRLYAIISDLKTSGQITCDESQNPRKYVAAVEKYDHALVLAAIQERQNRNKKTKSPVVTELVVEAISTPVANIEEPIDQALINQAKEAVQAVNDIIADLVPAVVETQNVDEITHTFRLRPQKEVSFKLPSDLTQTEADRLARFIASIPFA